VRRIGHRGARGHAPENTIASFQKALDLGCDEVETDVWLVGDGRLLIAHDRPSSQTKLTLDEVLDFCRGRMGVNVELKAETSERAARDTGARVGALLARRNDPDVYVSSFWWPALEAARSADPSLRRAFLFADAPDRAALLRSAHELGLWALHPNRSYVTENLVRDAHREGFRVNVWTVDDVVQMKVFAGWGVDGIMSDYPERVPKS
jgi:glycerophosphoryl diester phosphodiesterase